MRREKGLESAHFPKDRASWFLFCLRSSGVVRPSADFKKGVDGYSLGEHYVMYQRLLSLIHI